MRIYATHSCPGHVRGLLVGLIGVVGMVGCSQDLHVFESTSTLPVTVAVVNPITDTTLWEMDVPVDHKLKLDLDRPLEFEPVNADMRPATKLRWRVYQTDAFGTIEKDRMDLPGQPVLIRISYRPVLEEGIGAAMAGEESIDAAVSGAAESAPGEAATPEADLSAPAETFDADPDGMPAPEEAGDVIDIEVPSDVIEVLPEEPAEDVAESAEETVEEAADAVDAAEDEAAEEAADDGEALPLPGLD